MLSLKSMTFVCILLIYCAFTLTLATADWPTDWPRPTENPIDATTIWPGRNCPTPPRPGPTDPPPTEEPTYPPTDEPSMYVELRGGNYYEGNVFAENRYWEVGPVCDDHWGCNEANVVCRQLGFDYAAKYYQHSSFGQVSSDFAMDDVSCQGYEKHLQDCYYHTDDDCNYNEGAGVMCWMWAWGDPPTERPPTDRPTDRPTERPTKEPTKEPTHRPTEEPTENPTDWPTEDPIEGDCPTPPRPGPTEAPGPTDGPYWYVELQGGNYYEGNVFAENREWDFGPVCDDQWGCDEANVVCRQLGFDYAAKYYQGSSFGQVSSDFAMDDVSCTGYERHLQDCYYVTNDDCGNYEGAGVKCWMWDWDRPTDSPTDSPTTTWPTSTTHRPFNATCPHGWLDADYLGCFKLINDGGIMWPMAQQVCEDMGGYLAQPNSDEKHQLLASFIEIDETYEGYANWWIGLTDQGHEGRWEWAHSSEFLEPYEDDQWGHGSPHQDDNNHNDCVIFRHSDGYRWADVDCFANSADGIRNAIICEREN